MLDSSFSSIDLSQIAKIYSGYAFKSRDLVSEPKDGIPILKIANIQNKKVLKECKGYLPTQLYLEKFGKYLLARDDFLIAMTGAGSVGKVGKMRGIDRQYLVNQRVAIVRTDISQANPEYIFQVLSHDRYESALYSLGLGAGQPNVSAKDIGALEIPYPPILTQRKISAVLSAYDDLIENNTRRIAILEEMAQALYREWFVHFRFPGHDTQVPGTSEVPGTLRDASSERDGRLPEGWNTAVLGDIAKEIRISVKPSEIDPTTPYIGLGHMPKKSIALSDWGTASEAGSTKLVFNEGDILFGKIRPYFHKVGVAPIDGVCSTDSIVIVPKSPEWFSIVLGCVSSSEFVEHATQTSKGTKMPRADWNVLVKYPIVIPSEDLLSMFNQNIEHIVQLIRNFIYRNANLRQTRDLLLPRLISGELEVSTINIERSS